MRRCIIRVAFILYISVTICRAGSAAWSATPASGDWNIAANWQPMTVPNGPSDIASFGFSNTTAVALSQNTEVDSIVFNADASAFTITVNSNIRLTISGAGVLNNSMLLQTIQVAPGTSGSSNQILFSNAATAGTSTIINNLSGASGPGGLTGFADTSTAGGATINNFASASNGGSGVTLFLESSSAANAVINNYGGVPGTSSATGGLVTFSGKATAASASISNYSGSGLISPGGMTRFIDSSTAGAATILNQGGGNGGIGGQTLFLDNSTAATARITNGGGSDHNDFGGVTDFLGDTTAANATIINNGATDSQAAGGTTLFGANATAGNSTLIANGGTNGGPGGGTIFSGTASGGTARMEVFENGYLDISQHAPGLTTGSIEGDGKVFLGSANLTVGSSGASTTFSGTIQDGGLINSTGGSLTKIGSGVLTLSGTNTYTGTTTVQEGALLINGSITSNVTANGGILGGVGTMRDVTINKSATLSPGISPGILHIIGQLSLALGSTYLVDLNGSAVGTQYDQTRVSAMISSDHAALVLQLGFAPVDGMQFEIVDNESNEALSGTFNNLPEGASFVASGQAFTISYQGGDGNDIVITAVPEPATILLFAPAGLLFGFLYLRGRFSNGAKDSRVGSLGLFVRK